MLAAATLVETVGDLRQEVDDAVKAALGSCLTETHLDIGPRTVVRSN